MSGIVAGEIWTADANFTGRKFDAFGLSGNRLYLSGATGVTSYDGAVVSETRGINERVNALAVDPTNANVAYAGTNKGSTRPPTAPTGQSPSPASSGTQ